MHVISLTAVEIFGSFGFQLNSLTAKRYLSVAAKVIVFPSISTLIPVSIGNASSLPAATATWATDSENVFAFTEPLVFGSGGS